MRLQPLNQSRQSKEVILIYADIYETYKEIHTDRIKIELIDLRFCEVNLKVFLLENGKFKEKIYKTKNEIKAGGDETTNSNTHKK